MHLQYLNLYLQVGGSIAPAAANTVTPSGSTAQHVRQHGDQCLNIALAKTFRFIDDEDDEIEVAVEWYKRGAITIMTDWCVKHPDLCEADVQRLNDNLEEWGIDLDFFLT